MISFTKGKYVMRIIIADADDETIEDISLVIKQNQSDWRVFTTNSGRQCLDMVKKSSCASVIITGMQLSDITGLELLMQIRDDYDVPVIVISPDNDISTLVSAFDAGANDYIVKPFNKAIFMAKVMSIIRRREWDIKTIERPMSNINNE
jgi:two-component system KDP operon response regulator KdpE